MFACCEAMLDTLFCVRAAFKKRYFSINSLYSLCICKGEENKCGREQDESLLVPGFVEVACMFFCMCVCVPLHCVHFVRVVP